MIRLLLFLLLLFSLPGRAQRMVQVVTKVVERELPAVDGQTIRLNAQKADVTVRGWNRPTVSVRLRLRAKHPDRAVAEREVTYHQYGIEGGKTIDLSNRFVIPQSAGRLQSQLTAVYEIFVPEKAMLSISNSFGDVALRGLSGEVTLRFEFGHLTADNMTGKLNITSNYGDIDGRGLNANLTLNVAKASVNLRDLGGTAQIKSEFGRLTMHPNAQTLTGLQVETDRSDVTLQTPTLSDFRYDITATHAGIRVADGLATRPTRSGSQQTFVHDPPGRKPAITIRANYANVLIEIDKTVVNR
jgi:hypothetical protein